MIAARTDGHGHTTDSHGRNILFFCPCWSVSVRVSPWFLAATPDGAGRTLDVPIRDADLKDGNYIDMPEGQVRQTFYVAITLK